MPPLRINSKVTATGVACPVMAVTLDDAKPAPNGRPHNVMKLYHFTRPANLPSIRERGLLPHVTKAEDGAKWGRVVWFTTFAPRPGEARALAVEIDRSDPRLEFAERLRPGVEWWVYRGVIPPEKIAFRSSTRDTRGSSR